MEERTAGSWTELNEILYQGSWQEDIGRFRSTWLFRGMPRNSDLLTGLNYLQHESSKLERHLFRNFRKYARNDVGAEDSIWFWLALAQHHGLPTRLLDWTYSPLVALHFATCDDSASNADGVVWNIDNRATSQFLPEALKSLLSEEGILAFTTEMLDQVATTLDQFDALSQNPFVIFLEPPSIDARIVNQFALFSVMSDVNCRLDHWLEQYPTVYRKIIIPADLKREVRDKLDQANITERVLMPGLDGLCQWLKRYYSPRSQL